MDDLYDFHAQMKVHEEAPIVVHVTQPQIEQQQPHPYQEPQMVVLRQIFNDFRPLAIVLPHNRPRLVEGQMLDMDMGLQMKDKGMSSEDVWKEETQHGLTPKFVEKSAKEVLENNKIVEMFQAMATVSMKMGNLGLEVQSLKTRLTVVEGENKDY